MEKQLELIKARKNEMIEDFEDNQKRIQEIINQLNKKGQNEMLTFEVITEAKENMDKLASKNLVLKEKISSLNYALIILGK